jgi:hypothetical protein
MGEPEALSIITLNYIVVTDMAGPDTLAILFQKI